MKLFLIETEGFVYDGYDGHVILAESEQRARELASGHSADEGKEVWFKESTKVTEIVDDGVEGIILSAFNAG